MKLPALIAAPLAWIYGLIINVRHKLFDLKILRSEEFDIPVVCVGNLTVGGTGKTPVHRISDRASFGRAASSRTFSRVSPQDQRVRAL